MQLEPRLMSIKSTVNNKRIIWWNGAGIPHDATDSMFIPNTWQIAGLNQCN